ncbi:MAG: hypothetical protein QGF59_25320, partial [Pirellulaceae bacterium]|nr:hypothetical protein [Pirellulaceae bacterium]
SAARITVCNIKAALLDMPHHVDGVQRAIETHACKIPTLREIVEEIVQLEDEFSEVDYSLKNRTLSVVTEPIELDGVYLGPFEIRLHVERIASENPQNSFDVVALDSHPASSNNSVTHPHISDERMCCGDASLPIKSAVEGGRLSDLFCLIRSVLETYNPDSPYISLDSWYGRPCHDCGYTIPEDETYWCSSCERDFCDECASSCSGCSETTCGGCLKECPVCDDRYCDRCITTCSYCGETICSSCLEEQQCPCIEEREQENEDNKPEEKAKDPAVEVSERDRETDGRVRVEAA